MTNEPEPIPPMPHVDDAPPIHTHEELRQRWRSMLGAGGFGCRQLWLVWFDGTGTMLPVIVPIDGIETWPDEQFVGNLAQIVSGICQEEPGRSVAMALCRNGPPTLSDADLAWARDLATALAELDVSHWPLHLATPDSVRPVTPDDLPGRRSA